MTQLADTAIVEALHGGRIRIDPPLPVVAGPRLQPASIDVHLSSEFQVLTPGGAPINPASPSPGMFVPVGVDAGAALQLDPGECALGVTAEHLTLPDDIVGYIHGKSSLGRLFLAVHVTAGLLDPGWSGHITLELVNLAPRPFLLWPGMAIGQVTFEAMTGPAERPYGSAGLGSRYQNQAARPVLARSPHGHPLAGTEAAA